MRGRVGFDDGGGYAERGFHDHVQAAADFALVPLDQGGCDFENCAGDEQAATVLVADGGVVGYSDAGHVHPGRHNVDPAAVAVRVVPVGEVEVVEKEGCGEVLGLDVENAPGAHPVERAGFCGGPVTGDRERVLDEK